MAETVTTGGNVQFQYQRGHNPKIPKEYKLEIDEAYNKYYKRKKREGKRNIILLIVIVLLIILALAIFFLRG